MILRISPDDDLKFKNSYEFITLNLYKCMIKKGKKDNPRASIVKTLRIMKLTVSFLFVAINLCIASESYSQSTVFSIELKNKTLREVFSEIEKNSEFVFFYNDNVIDNAKKVSVNVKDKTVDKILEQILNPQENTYVLVNRQIFIYKVDDAGKAVKEVQQNPVRKIYGQVVDNNKEPLIGATVAVKGTTNAVMTDVDGKFSITANIGDVLVVSFVGYTPQEIELESYNDLNILLLLSGQMMDEVVVTAWGREKKTTMVGSVSSVSPAELKGPTSNLTTMLAGRVAGVIGYQLSGEPGRDNAEFFVRGVGTFGTQSSPLILINGIESSSTELARVQPDDIESFSVLKDATATSMYGSRGANGVLLITTKGGKQGKTKFNVRYEASISSNAKDFNLADNITYMTLENEASLTRNKDGIRAYNPRKIDKTRAGIEPLLYPNNNWRELMIKDNTVNHRVNMNASGGSDRMRYYLSGTYKVDNGVLKEHTLNDFDTNVKSSTIEIRSNMEVDMTSSTVAVVRISGLFDQLNGPSVGTGSDVFRSMLRANPVAFPAVFPQSMMPGVKHPLFGNASLTGGGANTQLYYNPYAQALSGYSEEKSTAMTAQIEVHQNFDFITPGLKARMMAYTKRNTKSGLSRSVNPFYYMAIEDPFVVDKLYGLSPLNENSGREYLVYNEGGKEVWNENWLEIASSYERTFNKMHAVGANFVGYIREKQLSNAGTLERSLPQRNVSLSGRLTYGFDNRYLGEFNFGYNASERFDKNNRWGFFPSVGLAWNLAEEAFMEPTRTILDKFKVRVSYGLVGNDELTDWINNPKEERYFYLNMVNMSAGNAYFGDNWDYIYRTVATTRYGNSNIGWEKSYKSNLAFEIGLLNSSFNLEMDFFRDKRTNILLSRSGYSIPSSVGLAASVRANVGEMLSKGFEATMDYNKMLTKDMWLTLRGTFTYSDNETKVYEEPEYPESLKHLSKVGYNWNINRGYIAEYLFADDDEVRNSPRQFGNYMAGDIKYYDVNGDGEINSNDMVPMGYPSVPKIVYGFGFSLGYKDFDLSAFFQGQAQTSFMISYNEIAPFIKNTANGQQSGLLEVIANDHWSENNRNPYAFFPRLSTVSEENNRQQSSWWLRDGSFLRLKTVELGYEPKGNWVKKIGVGGFRIYANGMNLFTFSKFKLWDVEMKGNGLGYPLQRVINMGIQLSF